MRGGGIVGTLGSCSWSDMAASGQRSAAQRSSSGHSRERRRGRSSGHGCHWRRVESAQRENKEATSERTSEMQCTSMDNRWRRAPLSLAASASPSPLAAARSSLLVRFLSRALLVCTAVDEQPTERSDGDAGVAVDGHTAPTRQRHSTHSTDARHEATADRTPHKQTN